MASSYSTDLKLELMVTGENAGTWGDKTNTNLNLLQQAIAGYQEVSIAGGAQTTTLVMSNATISNARNAVIKLTGTITGNQIVTVPTGIEKTYIVSNGTVGAFTVQFIQAGGTGVTFATTDKSTKILFADGTNIVDTGTVSETGIQTLTNKTLTSPIINEIDDANSNEQIKFTATASAVNEFTVTNAATGNAPEISATGGDTNIDLKITPKGSGKINLDGIKFPNADGSNGQVLSTDGSGNLAFTTISSSPTQLVKSLPLGSGVSYTAGQVASINSSGDITSLPVLNTFGTARVNSSATAYTAISTDGSRAIKISTSGATHTISGVACTDSSAPVNGTTNVTSTVTNAFATNPAYGIAAVFPMTADKFYVSCFSQSLDVSCSFTFNRKTANFIVVVDASGNCTKGNEITTSNNDGSGYLGITHAKVLKNFVVLQIGTAVYQMHILSSTSTLTATTDSDIQFWTGANGKNSFLTTNNKLVLVGGNTLRIADFTASPATLGTKTDTTIFGDYFSGGDFGRMSEILDEAPEYILSTYTDTSAVSKYRTFSVNQTTGALTAVETGDLSIINSNSPNGMTFRDKNRFVGSNASFTFTNGVANSPSFNAPYSLGTIRYSTGDLYFDFGTSTAGFPQNRGFTIVAYGTPAFNYIGVVKTTDSTSPIDIVVNGVADGFTSLTPGTVYFTTSPADGTVSTSGAFVVGKAISTTEILLMKTSTN